MMPIEYLPHTLIMAFFHGDDDVVRAWDEMDGNNNHLWICRHGQDYETLTLETWDDEYQCLSGQYEVAVRFTNIKVDDDNGCKYPGYYATKGGYIVGVGTGGH